jgi:hypothetical protein
MFKRFLFPILVLFLLACPSRQASSLGERALPELSHKELLNLVSSPDPAKNVDPSNPSSHLSKILIPRVRELIAVTYRITLLSSFFDSRDRQQHISQKIHHLHTSGP